MHMLRVAEERLIGSSVGQARTDAPDILFIVMDTVRSSNLSAYGYARPTSPEIERWIRTESGSRNAGDGAVDPTLTCDDVYRTVSPRASSRLADAAGFRTAHARRDTGRTWVRDRGIRREHAVLQL